MKRLTAGEVTSESHASSAWLRHSDFSTGILNHKLPLQKRQQSFMPQTEWGALDKCLLNV